MIKSVLKSTRGKPCSCPTGKICPNCKSTKNVDPQVTVEKSRIPVTITYYKSGDNIYKQNPTVQYLGNPKRWKIHQQQNCETSQPKSTSICRWYKRRKALKQLIKEHEKEKEILRKKQQDEYERERIIELLNWKQSKQERASSLPPSQQIIKWERKTKRHQSLPPRNKLIYVKERSAIVKPHARSKYISVKQRIPKDSITKRFVNYCYRFCCQLYCYLTCIVIIVITIIFIL